MARKLTILLVIITIILSSSQGLCQFRCVAVDVGEGQAVLLQRGEFGILIDTGHFGQSFKLLSALREYGVTTIEKVILTHLDADHATGIFTIMNSFSEARIYESGHRIGFHPFLDGYRWVAEQLDSGPWKVNILRQGDEFIWRDIHFSVLWPDNPQGEILNSQSLVLSIRYKRSVILVMGDADSSVEERLLHANLLPGKVDVLIAGHHGAGDASSLEFLQHTQPRYAVVSVNHNNKKGYPDKKVLNRMKKQGALVHVTAEKGDFIWHIAE